MPPPILNFRNALSLGANCMKETLNLCQPALCFCYKCKINKRAKLCKIQYSANRHSFEIFYRVLSG